MPTHQNMFYFFFYFHFLFYLRLFFTLNDKKNVLQCLFSFKSNQLFFCTEQLSNTILNSIKERYEIIHSRKTQRANRTIKRPFDKTVLRKLNELAKSD